jgi:hypothetical protein
LNTKEKDYTSFVTMSLRPVNPSFEIGGSVFNSFKALRGLIAVTSEDDVHTQAVLAVEQLGACIPVAAERIDEAVNALGGNTSIRVENLKASIGISSGGLCKVMRESTPLLQFFALCAACKTIFLDDECGTLMFEMLKTSKVLAKLPCSAIQIVRMITQFSGQAGTVAPVDMMHEVASAVDGWSPEPGTFQHPDYKVLAELLLTLFEHVRDEAVESILLVGHRNSIWLASSLLWLLEDKAWLLIGDKVIKGNPQAKLCIQIEPKVSIPWKLQIFKESGDPIKYIYEMFEDEADYFIQLPLRLLKSFMDQYYWYAFENPQTRRKAMIATGIVAETLVMAISERGHLYLKCDGFTSDEKCCNRARLTSIVPTTWLARIEQVITTYGWNDDERAGCDPGLLAAILQGVDYWGKHPGLRDLANCVKEPCLAFIQSYFPEENVKVDYILDPAFFIAADVTVTSTAFFDDGSRFIKLLDDETVQFANETVLSILGKGLEVSEFRKRAFEQLLPGLEVWHEGDLVVARDGYVVGMNILWQLSCQSSGALRIRVQRGQIKKDQVTYNSIRENWFNPIVSAGPRVPAFDPVRGLVLPEVGWQNPIRDSTYTFETSASVYGTKIEIKHYMIYTSLLTNLPQRRKAPWVGAINILATAIHMDTESQNMASLNKALNLKISQQLIAKDVCWTDPFSSPKIEAAARTLIRSGNDPKVKIFGAGACNKPRSLCCYIVIRHRSPLLQCIDKAESSMLDGQDSWIVVD